MGSIKENFNPLKWIERRDYGIKKISDKRQICQHLYSHIKPVFTWNPHESGRGKHHGAIFNFDYSTDGSLLVAACQHRSFLMFDPYNGHLINERLEAHTDCVNCVRFLDTRLFATCSDDKTVALWDCRFLKTKIKSLYGHRYWVKNIEYDSNQGLMVTSGFDGKICTWDINNFSVQVDEHKQVFTAKGLMRSKLSPDNNKLIISTSRGYMVIIHDLDLLTLADDLQDFRPDVYRVSRTNTLGKSELVVRDSPYFHRKRNRVEFISDFPDGNEAEVIASLQVHPQGWCIASRNTSADSNTEWVCVHDIQVSNGGSEQQDSTSMFNQMINENMENNLDSLPKIEVTFYSDTSDNSSYSEETDDEFSQNLNEALQNFSERSGISHNFNSGSMTFAESSSSNSSPTRGDKPETVPSVVKRNYDHPSLLLNKPRLLFYQEEPNVGEGFIKEIGFSYDGRVICSPYKDGVRLLTFNDKCDEICDYIPKEPKPLNIYNSSQTHSSYVLASKFSPTQYTFVSGSLNGKVVFHQPVL